MDIEVVDKEALLEDIKFPLQWDSDYKLYIFDSEMKMVVSLECEFSYTCFNNVIGDYKYVYLEDDKNCRYFYDKSQGDFYDRKRGARIGSVRGYGSLQYKYGEEEVTKRQNNIANYILSILNKEKKL